MLFHRSIRANLIVLPCKSTEVTDTFEFTEIGLNNKSAGYSRMDIIFSQLFFLQEKLMNVSEKTKVSNSLPSKSVIIHQFQHVMQKLKNGVGGKISESKLSFGENLWNFNLKV